MTIIQKHPAVPAVLSICLFALVFVSPGRAQNASSPKEIPIPVQRLLQKVRAAMDEENYPAAIRLIREQYKPQGKQAEKPPAPCSHPIVCLALGNCHLLLKAYPQAETAYTAALAMDPECMDARVNLAKVYTDSGNYPRAAETFAAAYDRSLPKVPAYLYYSAVMTLMAGEPGDAALQFETLFSAHPDRVTRQWRESYANALMRAEYWEKAVPVVRALARETTGEEQIRWQETLLQIFLTMDDLKRAKKWATALARKAPDVPRWWKALVHIHLSQEAYAKALDCLIIYGFVTPLSGEEKKLAADLSLQLGLPARAAGMYEAILAEETSCKRKELLRRLVSALRQMGKPDRALALINGIPPRDCAPELLLLKGDILYETRDFKAADTAYRLAAKNNCPRKGQAWLMAGYAAWQCNNLPASRIAFEQAARFKRHRKDALAAIAQLDRATPM